MTGGVEAEHLRADAIAALTAFDAPDADQQRLQAQYLRHLQAHPDGMLKSGPPAHLTASCLVLSTDGTRVLLTHHRRARRWFQFGGHLEVGDAGLHAAATREAREESGLFGLTPAPTIVELNRHRLEGDFGTCREHLDVRYAALAPGGAQPAASDESIDLRWWPVEALPEGPVGEVADLVAAGRRALGFGDVLSPVGPIGHLR